MLYEVITFIFGMPINGNLFLLALVNLMFLFAALSLGIMIASFAETQHRITSYNVCYTKLLRGYLCGQSLPDNLALKFPNAVLLNNDTINNRPELKLFSAQDMSFQSRISLIKTKNNPKLYLFASGGYGKPGLNMFNDELDSYGIAGIRLTIPITNRLYGKHETQSLIYQKELITSQRTDFLKNNTIQLSGQLIEIEKFKSLIDKDEEIITKRTAIRIAEETRLNNGISTSTDYIRELNAENRAKLNLKLHEIQLLQAIINYNALKGN